MLLQQAEKKIFGLLSICIVGSNVLNREKSFGADYLSNPWKEKLRVRWVLERDPKWAKSPSLERKVVQKWRYMERTFALPDSARKSFIGPICYRTVATMMWCYFFSVYFWDCYLFNSFLCCSFSSHLHEFRHFRRVFWKSLIIIKWIDLNVALVIIFKRMQEGLRKDFQSAN